MNTQFYQHMSRIFGVIAIVTAFTNAYLLWAEDDFSLFLFILMLSFSMLAVVIQYNVNKYKKKNDHDSTENVHS